MENTINQDQVLQTERSIPYTPDQIYTAFADPAHLAKWWGPTRRLLPGL